MPDEQNSPEKENACLVITEQRLLQFCQSPLAQLPKQGFEKNSTSVILICAFLLGAIESLGSTEEELQLALAEQLDIDDRGTSHLIDTTQRLCIKYPLIAQVLEQGRKAASVWQHDGEPAALTALNKILEQNQNLTLMDLDTLDVTPKEPVSVVRHAAPQHSRLRPLLLILLAISILAAANYLLLTVF